MRRARALANLPAFGDALAGAERCNLLTANDSTVAETAARRLMMTRTSEDPDGRGGPVTPSHTAPAAVVWPDPMARSVIVVEDDAGLREQLVKILNSAPRIRCVGACASAEEALEVIPARKPDVVLMDIRLPASSGIECVAALKQILPNLPILMLTVYEDSESIFRALKAGAQTSPGEHFFYHRFSPGIFPKIFLQLDSQFLVAVYLAFAGFGYQCIKCDRTRFNGFCKIDYAAVFGG